MLVAASNVPLALAFGAGLVATVNPCGFAMLPSIVTYYLGSGGSARNRPARVAEGLFAGLVLTAGFMILFGLVGTAVALGSQPVVRVVPWAAIVIGLGLMALGGWLLAGRHFVVPVPGLGRPEEAGYRSLFLLGVAYAVGSLSCTLPVFLVVVGSALAAGSVLGTLSVFLAYGLGMSTILMLLCLGTAGFRELIARAVRPVLPSMNRVSGGLLVLGGGYVAYYWLSLLYGSESNAPIRFVQELQGSAQDLVLRPGERFWFAAGLALLIGAVLAVALGTGRGSADEAIVELSSNTSSNGGERGPKVEDEGVTQGRGESESRRGAPPARAAAETALVRGRRRRADHVPGGARRDFSDW